MASPQNVLSSVLSFQCPTLRTNGSLLSVSYHWGASLPHTPCVFATVLGHTASAGGAVREWNCRPQKFPRRQSDRRPRRTRCRHSIICLNENTLVNSGHHGFVSSPQLTRTAGTSGATTSFSVSGWEAGIRTPISRSRVCRLTVRRPPIRRANWPLMLHLSITMRP